jgi:5'-methylthioadenosine phosphorylase
MAGEAARTGNDPFLSATAFWSAGVPFVAMDQLKVGVIGGSGLGQLLGDHATSIRHEVDTPFGRPSDGIIEANWAGVPVFLLARHGPGHVLNPSAVPFRANIYALKELGCTHILASGAVGSLREEYKPKDLVIPDQVIDKTNKRANTFFEHAAVHVEFAEPFCPVLRQMVIEAARSQPTDHTTHSGGCYVVMEGPAFSSRAESLMHRLWGGDLIGMTAMPEAKLAREAEISYALISLVTDYDCWRHKPAPVGEPQVPVDPDLLLKEIIGNLQSASASGMALIRKTIELLASKSEEALAAPSRQALKLAIWSDKSKILPEEAAKLKPLWGRYF